MSRTQADVERALTAGLVELGEKDSDVIARKARHLARKVYKPLAGNTVYHPQADEPKRGGKRIPLSDETKRRIFLDYWVNRGTREDVMARENISETMLKKIVREGIKAGWNRIGGR